MAYTKQNTRVDRVQINTTFTPGTATALKANTEFFVQNRLLVNDSDATDFIESPWKSVNVDLLDPARASDVITAAGKTVNPLQLAALIRQYALDRANAAGIT